MVFDIGLLLELGSRLGLESGLVPKPFKAAQNIKMPKFSSNPSTNWPVKAIMIKAIASVHKPNTIGKGLRLGLRLGMSFSSYYWPL